MTYFPPVNMPSDRARAYPRYVFEGVHHSAVVNVPHVFRTLQTLEQLVDSIVAAIGSRSMAPSTPHSLGRTILVNLPCMFQSVHTPRHVDAVSLSGCTHPQPTNSAPAAVASAALGIAFPPALEAMVATMLRTLRAGGTRFYGLIASEPADVQALLGRNQTRLGLLLAAAHTYFGPPRPCYLGMEWLHDVRGRAHLDMQDRVVGGSPCTALTTKYQLMDGALLQGMPLRVVLLGLLLPVLNILAASNNSAFSKAPL